MRYAVEKDAVTVTKDSDFLPLAPPPPLLVVTTGNIPNQALLELFQAGWATLSTAW